MFVLDREQFGVIDRRLLPDFVNYWIRFYRGSVATSPTDQTPIDYPAELNLGQDLSERNIVRLLRWKDPARLTHPKNSGQHNNHVEAVLNVRGHINNFRRVGDATAFLDQLEEVFPNGIVWKLFLFHIARPWEWPIADQHVFRAYSRLFAQAEPRTIKCFERYRATFLELAELLHTPDGAPQGDIVNRNKRLDSALMAYGQFLWKYDH